MDRLLDTKTKKACSDLMDAEEVISKSIFSDGPTVVNGSIMHNGRNFTRLQSAGGVRATSIS